MEDNNQNLNLAAIDIGSNAARLLISQVLETENEHPQFIKVNLVRVPLRLGFDVFESGYISKQKEEDIVDTLLAYKKLMKIHRVSYYKICATSAMRDAINSKEVIARVKELTDVEIKVINGKEEAAIIFENHIENFLDKDHSYLYIDVGGGSTELTLFDNNQLIFNETFNVGTVRMLKSNGDNKEWQRMKEFVKSEVNYSNNLMGIGSGGNINKVASLAKIKGGKPLSIETLKEYYDNLSELSVEERMKKYNLREDRADVIVPALQIYTNIMRWANINEIHAPKFGLADGIIRSLFQQVVHQEIINL
ncbi:MAG: exopolyphosphatase [Bacteroidetes bacterium]|nr:exopolyphosphatase [Bacteroidota bacterium]